MNIKAIHNGHCLYCGKESETPFCNRQCYRDYVKGDYSEKDNERKQRELLTDYAILRLRGN